MCPCLRKVLFLIKNLTDPKMIVYKIISKLIIILNKSACFLEPCRGPPLKPQMSITELLNSSRSEQHHLLGDDESTGLQEHTEQNCLYCCAINVLGSHTHSHLNNTRTGEQTHAAREFQLHKTSFSFQFL